MKTEIDRTPMEGTSGVKDKNQKDINAELAGRVIQATERTLENTKSLTERLKDAQNALDLACRNFRAGAINFLSEDMPKAINDVRQARMAFGNESSQLMRQMQDLRTFFVGPDYEKEVTRLKDFVTLCDRLKALKDSGFLDTVADTMLKLANAPSTGSCRAESD